MRTGWLKAVHVKTQQAQECRLLLRQRCLLVNGFNFGLKMGRAGIAVRVRELLEDRLSLLRVVEPVLLVQAMLLSQREALHRMVLQAVREEEVCRRMMTVPGVGPITALAFRVTVDQAEPFAHSRDVGAHFSLTPRRYQSGETIRRTSPGKA